MVVIVRDSGIIVIILGSLGSSYVPIIALLRGGGSMAEGLGLGLGCRVCIYQ